MINCSINLLTVFKLLNKKIQCYDKSRLLYAGNINTIFFDKTGTLSEDNLELKGFSPICICTETLNPILKYYDKNHIKFLSLELIHYYSNYFQETELSNNNISKNFSKKIMVLFIECLMCCNRLEEINNKIFGNFVEKEIFLKTKWKMKIDSNFYNKQFDEDNNIINNKIDENQNINNPQTVKNYKYKIKILDQPLEIYPSDYFKIIKNNKIINNNNFNQKNIYSINNSNQNHFENQINLSYKLHIYRRFIKVGTLYSSAIVYNPLIKSLYFMTKGPPEEIIPNCNNEFLPKDINKIITLYRKNGYINLILAAKPINKFDRALNEKNYMNNLMFCGIIILKNKLKKEAKEVIQQLQKLNCDLILNTGDNIYNALTISYESGITSKKNIFVFDLDNNHHISINNFTKIINDIQLNSTKKSSQNSPNKLNNKDTYSSKKIEFFINKLEKISSLLGEKKFINIEKNEHLNSLDKNKFKIIYTQKIAHLENIRSNVPKLTFTKKNKNNNFLNEGINENTISSKSKILQNNNLMNSGNEITKEDSKNNNALLNNKNFTFITNKNINSSIKGKKQHKYRNSEVYMDKNISNHKIIRKNSKNRTNFIIKPKTFVFNKISYQSDKNYFPSKLKEMREDSVYCVSGRALKFIYENRYNVEYKKYEFPVLLNHIKKFCKIFYDMSSKDKSLLIDYYRSLPDKITCMVGDGQNDIDAIMTSHVGINIKQPVNMNSALCHFHPMDGSLFCIEKIIRYGRITHENIILLEMVSFFYAVIIIFFIISLTYFKIEINSSHLNFVSVVFFILCFFAFNIQSDKSIKCSPLFHNQSLFKKFLGIIGFNNIIINLLFGFLLLKLYSKNKEIEDEIEKKIFGTYSFILCFSQILGMFFSINSINFYRKNYRNNFIYMIFLSFICSFLSFIINICGTSYPFISNFFTFELSNENQDTFDEKNKLLIFTTCICNVIIYYLNVFIIFKLLKKKAEKELEKNNKDKEEKKIHNILGSIF